MPTKLLEGVERNDISTWAALMMLEVRMLLARGQTYQARKIAELLPTAAEAGIPVETYERRDIQQLINAIDSSQAGRHFLALKQLEKMSGAPVVTIQWASQIWRSRSLSAVGDDDRAAESAQEAVAISDRVAPDARHWASCFAAEQRARAGFVEQAELDMLRVLSQFIGWGETRGESMAYLSLALVHQIAGATEESEAAAERSYRTDGSWTGPVVWLARLALERDEVDRAKDLLRSIPNPTTEAYNLTQALALIEAHDLPLAVVLEDLKLGRSSLNEQNVAGLRQLLKQHPTYTPARETLAFKLLSLGRPDEAREQCVEMVKAEADIQSTAAVRFGLQTFEEEQILDQLFADFSTAGPVGAEAEPPAPMPMPEAPAATVPSPEPEPALEPEAPPQPRKRPPPTAEVPRPEEASTLAPEPAPAPQPTPEPAPAAAPPAAASDKQSGIVGEISLFGVPDLLQFFCNSRRTGVITFSSQLGNAKIRMHEGALCWAVCPGNPSVGDFLGGAEAITQEQASQVGDDPDADMARLLNQGGADAEKVNAALRELLHLSLKELVDWTDGWFEFDRIDGAATPQQELQFNAHLVELDVMRELDEERR